MGSSQKKVRKRNWHHPFPAARFRNKVEIEVHEAYNQVFHGHRTAWEAEKFLTGELAGPDGLIPDEALDEEARETRQYRRWKEKRQKLASKKPNGRRQQKKAPPSFREAFELVFGTERRVERCVAILRQHPWMPPGVTYEWRDDKVILVFDYAEMRRAEAARNDVQGLVPKFS